MRMADRVFNLECSERELSGLLQGLEFVALTFGLPCRSEQVVVSERRYARESQRRVLLCLVQLPKVAPLFGEGEP